MGIPTAKKGVECQGGLAQFGDMTFIIGGREYTLSPEEWMFDPQTISVAQSGT